jgi:hypothetical protein
MHPDWVTAATRTIRKIKKVKDLRQLETIRVFVRREPEVAPRRLMRYTD